ncbi:MAG TPA: EAL domain-containing protein, partial [Kofleriaceae bacterium]|nr:EAL domain-containing protein [Kofleriaceae bacterium]
LASHVALDLVARTRDARRGRLAWLTAASIVMGVGVWSMHFIGMFALSLETDGWPMQIGYQQGQVLGSLLVAIAGSVLALGIASRRNLSGRALAACGLLMGGAISWMHYVGMSAVVMAATIQYTPSVLALSLATAVVISTLALALARPGETKAKWEQWTERAASVVMGVAIAGMHYTAMAASNFTPTGDGMMTMTGSVLGNAVLGTSDLVVVVAMSALAVLAIGLLVGALDRQHGRRLAARMQVGEARYRSLTQSATDAILSADAQGRIVSWNVAAEKIFGFAESEVLGRPLITLVAPPYHANWATAVSFLADAASASFGRTVELDGLRRDGRPFPMEIALSQWSDGDARFITGIIRDITERKLADAALRESERRFRKVVEQSPEAIVLHANGLLLYANPAAASLIGAPSSSELAGRRFVSIVHPGSQDIVTSRRSVLEDRRQREMLQYQLLHRDGRALDVEATSVPSTFNGSPAVQTHLRDVTSQKVLEAQLAHQAFHDALTGLANRALFRDRVDHAIARSARHGAAPAVLFLDLDNFKAVNDGLGHAAGDELLCTVARRLQNVMRASDTCARLGGDEFAVLIEEPPDSPDSGAHAAHVAERMIAALNTVCAIAGADIGMTVSVGIAVARRGETGDELLRNADLAMYRAKSNGKNRYEMFEPAMHDVVRKRLELESELRRAIDQCAAFTHQRGMPARTSGEQPPFVVHYQPIASLDTSEVRSFEALVRWVHPTRGLVPPLDFIPIAEETGLIVPLGRWILREACTQARRWQEMGCQGLEAGQIGVTINLSARQLLQNELPDDVRAALDLSGLAPESLTLEMTESRLIDDSEATLGRLRALKALGVRLAIDDFGTGYSSLAYLERFPVDLLKIDRSFVDKIGLGDGESPLARAILGLGRELGMRVVAEGIETEAQWTRLRELGCELGQGFYLARPKPANELGRVQRGVVAA